MSDMSGTPQNRRQRAGGRPFVKGQHTSPATEFKPGNNANPGGRPKSLTLLERAIREAEGDHVLGVLASMRESAHGVECCDHSKPGEQVVYSKPPDPNAARVYLGRVLGPERIPSADVTAMHDDELRDMMLAALGLTLDQYLVMKASTATTPETQSEDA